MRTLNAVRGANTRPEPLNAAGGAPLASIQPGETLLSQFPQPVNRAPREGAQHPLGRTQGCRPRGPRDKGNFGKRFE